MVTNAQKHLKRNIKIKGLAFMFFSFSIFLPQISARALSPGYNYYCFTEKYKIKTSSNENGVTYYGFNDTVSESFETEPDIKLTNGRFYFKTKNKLIMTWQNGANYTYQVTINGPHDVEGIGYPSSGNIVIRHRGKVIIRQPCIKLSSGEPF
jgi:hypothetical protein